MELFRRRPLFLCCVLCMLACAAGAFLPAAWRWVLFGAVCLGALLAGLWMLCRKKLSASLTAVAAGSLALLALLHSSLYFHGQEARTLTSLEGQSVVAEGIITDRRSNGEYLTSYSMQLTAADGKEIRAQALLTCLYVSDLQPGHVVSMEVTVLPLSEAAGDGYDATALLGDGYRVGLRSDSDTSVTILSETGGGLRVKAGALRRSLSARLGLITKNAEGLPSALLLGDKSGLSDAVRRDFARSGASHLLAISGFHVTLLFGMAEGLLRLLRIRKQIRVLLLSGSAVAYLILLGFPPSATRAVIMLGVVYLSTLLRSRSDPLTSLGLAGAAILTTTPYAVADAGFWMSFLAAFGLVTVMPVVNGLLPAGSGSTPGQKLLRGAAKRLAALAVGVVAMSFTLFIVASITGELGVFSPLTTLLLTPLCAVVLLLSLLALPLSNTPLGLLLGRAVTAVCGWMADVTEWVGDSPSAVVSLRHPAVIPVALLMVAAVIFLLVIRLPRRRQWVVVLPLVAGWVIVAGVLTADSLLTRDVMGVTYLQPSTQSDMLVLTEGREAVICDLGNGSLTSMTAATREAETQGATEIAVLMLTHYHSRTSGALHTVLGREKVRRLWLPYPKNEEDYYLLLSCLEQADSADVPVVLYEAEEALLLFNSCELTLETTFIERSVQPVLLLSLDAGQGGHVVYCGSAVFESALSESARRQVSQADTVIFGNHGPLPKTSFGEDLFFREDAAVILSAHGDVAGYFSTNALSNQPIHMGQWRGTVPLEE